jgi:peptidyl-prolyl cis-trans isomerase C
MKLEVSRKAMLRILLAIATVWLASLAPAILAADPADTVLVRRGDVTITRADWDAELARIPEKDRADFAASPRRVRQLLDRMLQTRDLALKAKAAKLAPDPAVLARPGMDEERALAAAMVENAEAAAARDFDVRKAAFERRARELYAIDPASFASKETVTITLVYFSSRKDGVDAAAQRATDTLAKAKAGADLADLAATLSEDATTRGARGRRGPVARGDLDATLAAAAFDLANPGDLAPVVRVRDGFFVVRLDERRPAGSRTFDEAKPDIMAMLRQRHIEAAREALYQSLGAGKELVVNQAAIDALRTPAK